jgi:transposase InsO family protein
VELHGNARLTPYQRELMCRRIEEEGWTAEEAAEAAGCSQRTCYRWLKRWRAGEPMTDRSSAPHHVANRTPDDVVALIEQLRRLRWTSIQIAVALEMAISTVCAVLTRLGLQRRSRLEPPEPPNRYCRRHPGELIHVDVKKLGRFKRPGHRVIRRGPGTHSNRGIGWEFVHVAIDDTSRVAYLETLPDEKGATCIAFLERAIAWFAQRGVSVQRVMTDNGSGYCSKVHAAGIARLGIRHLRTQPYRPRTNGKAERFIQTMLRECAYRQAFQTSQQRRQALRRWLSYYNCRRPHSALGHHTPISRLEPAD